MKILRKWFREWVLIDVLVLGGGILASLVALSIPSNEMDNQPALIKLIANLSPEILGAWLSIRVIDYLINRRNKYLDNRHSLVGNCHYMLTTAERILPNYYRFSIQYLREEIEAFSAQWDRRKKHFSHDEIADVEIFIATGKKTLACAERVLLALDTNLDLRAKAFDQEDIEHNQSTGELVYVSGELWFKRIAREVDSFRDANSISSEVFDAVTSEFDNAKNKFSEAMRSILSRYIETASQLHLENNNFQQLLTQMSSEHQKLKQNIYEETSPDD